jgi:two-component system cell cycle sensor histidine kinase/response regulator CckA
MTTPTDKAVTQEELQRILAALMDIMRGNFDGQLPVADPFNPIDAIHLAINTTAEELSRRTISKEYAENILQSMVDMVIVADRDGVIRNVNGAACSVLGYVPLELIGHPLERLIDPAVFQVGVRPAPLFEDGYLRDMDLVLTAKDRAIIPVMINGSTIHGGEGKIDRVILVARDMREIRRLILEAERAAVASSIIEGMRESVMITDFDGQILLANSEFSLSSGYTRGEAIGRSIFEMGIISKRDLVTLSTVVWPRLRDEGFIKNIETTIIRKDGTRYPALTNLVITKDPGGGEEAIICASRDITERKRAEEERQELELQLQQSQKMEAIGKLAGGIAHDTNNILGAIIGSASMLDVEIAQDSPIRIDVENILNACYRGRDLTRDLLGFARKGKYTKEHVSLNEVVEETETLLRRTDLHKIAIEIDLEEKLALFEGDANQIAHALMNVCINARDAMRGDGKLTISTRNVDIDLSSDRVREGLAAGRYVQLQVSDTGAGMDRKTIERVFEPFFTTKPVGEGTGLGLSMVYGTIKNHNGAVLIDSIPDRGTTVTFLLPVQERLAPPAPDIEPEAIQEADTEGVGVLVVDDESIIRKSTKRLLSRLGYKVFLAASGLEAVEIYQADRGRIALVLLDLIMPDMDGAETFTKLREIDPEARILLCSGYSRDEKVNDLLSRNARGFIQKPFDLQMLSHEVTAALS